MGEESCVICGMSVVVETMPFCSKRCKNVDLQWNKDRLNNLSLDDTEKDPKTRLQEYLQSVKKELPKYEVKQVTGEAHDQTFTVACVIETLSVNTSGEGSSRRHAEQRAAKQALKQLGAK